MDLPGIGSFRLDASTYADPDSARQGKTSDLEGVVFESKPSIKEAPDLVQFIADQTGKLKALAAADLNSHLELVQQFLNIGKPFLLEGIGSLVKIKSGEFSFTAGQIMPEKLKEYSGREIAATATSEDAFTDYKSVFHQQPKTVNWKKPVAILLVLAGIGLAIWGGYTVYKKTTAKKESGEVTPEQQDTIVITDTAQKTGTDSMTISPTVNPPAAMAGHFKFILETAPGKRAMDRFNKLKAFQWPVQMETKDSLSYTLFMLLPVNAADTARVRDSLTMLNGKRVVIEK
jgi:hypothetical protein